MTRSGRICEESDDGFPKSGHSGNKVEKERKSKEPDSKMSKTGDEKVIPKICCSSKIKAVNTK